MDLFEYGSTEPIFFKLTLNGVGVTGLTLATGDLQISKNGAAFTSPVASTYIAEEGLGWYSWTPQASETSTKQLIINIKDQSATPLFDENGKVLALGGNASALHNG